MCPKAKAKAKAKTKAKAKFKAKAKAKAEKFWHKAKKYASSVLSITFYSDIDKSWFWCYFKGPVISFKMTPKSALMDVGIKSSA